jgi:hypothetical protein
LKKGGFIYIDVFLSAAIMAGVFALLLLTFNYERSAVQSGNFTAAVYLAQGEMEKAKSGLLSESTTILLNGTEYQAKSREEEAYSQSKISVVVSWQEDGATKTYSLELVR